MSIASGEPAASCWVPMESNFAARSPLSVPLANEAVALSDAKLKDPEKNGEIPVPVADERSAAGANAELVPGALIMCMTDAGAVAAASSVRKACCVMAPEAVLLAVSISIPALSVVLLDRVVAPVV